MFNGKWPSDRLTGHLWNFQGNSFEIKRWHLDFPNGMRDSEDQAALPDGPNLKHNPDVVTLTLAGFTQRYPCHDRTGVTQMGERRK